MKYLTGHTYVYKHTFLIGILVIIIFFILLSLFRYFFLQSRVNRYIGSFEWVEMPSKNIRKEALLHKQKTIQYENNMNNTLRMYKCAKGDYIVTAHQMQGYYGNIKGYNPVMYGLIKTDKTVIIEPQFKDMTCPTSENTLYVQVFENNLYGAIRIYN